MGGKIFSTLDEDVPAIALLFPSPIKRKIGIAVTEVAAVLFFGYTCQSHKFANMSAEAPSTRVLKAGGDVAPFDRFLSPRHLVVGKPGFLKVKIKRTNVP